MKAAKSSHYFEMKEFDMKALRLGESWTEDHMCHQPKGILLTLALSSHSIAEETSLS